jgi:hypothetical protein
VGVGNHTAVDSGKFFSLQYFERLDDFLVGLPVLSAMNSALIDFAHQFSQFQEAVEMARTGEAWT